VIPKLVVGIPTLAFAAEHGFGALCIPCGRVRQPPAWSGRTSRIPVVLTGAAFGLYARAPRTINDRPFLGRAKVTVSAIEVPVYAVRKSELLFALDARTGCEVEPLLEELALGPCQPT
jgi:hypothetical protein